MTIKLHLHDFTYPTEAMLEAHSKAFSMETFKHYKNYPAITITHVKEEQDDEDDYGKTFYFDAHHFLVSGFENVVIDGCKVSGQFAKPIYIGEVITETGESQSKSWDCTKVCDDDLAHAISQHITGGDSLVAKIMESYASEI
jgi:hypothetical protein